MRNQRSNNWTVKRLDEVATVTMGQSPPSSSYNSEGIGVPFFQGKPQNVDNLGVALPQQHTTEPTKVVTVGTALMTVRAPVGDIFTSPMDVCIGRGLGGVRAIEGVSQEYLNYHLQFSSQQFHYLSQGSTFSAIKSSDLKGAQISIPELKVQQKIASILSSIDEDIQKTDQIIQKTEKLKQGLMSELLTKGIGHKKFKKTKLGEIPEEWEVVSVGQICECIVPGRNKPKFFDGEIPWITIPNIKSSRINYDNFTKYVSRQELKRCGNKVIPINSVIMSCVGEFGIVSKTDREIVINQQLHAFLPSEVIDSNFLMYSLINQKNYMENLATKTSVPYLNKTNCNSIPIAKPTIEEQRKIAQVFLEVDGKIGEEFNKKTKLELLKKGLMQDIFSQKVEVN
ncbi:restriction endonuclease subunit S [Patescibacteria group bacterium]|nr:restriction endonuclease subunit S [Patescibacteria group bacterium]